jgi:hypothetical protein
MMADSIDSNQPLDLDQFADDLNEELRASGSGSAEQAFSVGCAFGIIPVGLIVFVLYITGIVSLILALFLALLGIVVLVAVVALLASQARDRATQRVYDEQVEPRIEAYLSSSGLSRSEFDSLLYNKLSDRAPLRKFLISESTAIDSDQEKEIIQET